MTSKIPWFKHRDWSLTEKEVLEIISDLRRLEAETQPSVSHAEGKYSVGHAEGKDFASHMAILAASRLVDALVGWAFDHQVGMAINETLGVPDIPGVKAKNRSQYEERKRAADDHRHEETASAYDFENPVQNRRILARLLGLHVPGLPEELSSEAANALERLEFGDTAPLLDRRGVGRKKAYDKEILRFWAVLHVEYLIGLGDSRIDAKGRVGDAYAREPETIEGWISDLPNKVGHIENIAYSKHRARAAGERIRNDQSAATAADYQPDFDRLYGPSALTLHGDEYKRVAGHSEEKPRL